MLTSTIARIISWQRSISFNIVNLLFIFITSLPGRLGSLPAALFHRQSFRWLKLARGFSAGARGLDAISRSDVTGSTRRGLSVNSSSSREDDSGRREDSIESDHP